jgi:3-oxoacyl-[acyl-carrier-protein] synthase II
MNKRRVVVTGIGTINPIGNNVNETWENLIAGKNGIDLITKFDTSEFPSKIAGEIKNYDPLQYYDRKELKKIDLYAQYAVIAATEAMVDSGLDKFNFDQFMFGSIIGAGIGGMQTFEEETYKFFKRGARRISPFFIPKMISNMGAAQISIKYGLRGPNYNISSACASANHAIGTSFRFIQAGDADIMITGGAEASVTQMSLGGFCSMKALSTRNDEPSKACRPFDKERDGFIMAEGAGILILEELEHAKKRGAKIYAELAGFGATGDAYHITAPDSEGISGSYAIEKALKEANIAKIDVDYFNAHGTSTPLNDKIETTILKKVFGEHAKNISVNSTKSMIGHSLGAAAGIEAIACVKTITDGIVHPTINYENPDPECDLDYTPNKAIKREVRVALSNSLGFGGHNGVLVLKKI